MGGAWRVLWWPVRLCCEGISRISSVGEKATAGSCRLQPEKGTPMIESQLLHRLWDVAGDDWGNVEKVVFADCVVWRRAGLNGGAETWSLAEMLFPVHRVPTNCDWSGVTPLTLTRLKDFSETVWVGFVCGEELSGVTSGLGEKLFIPGPLAGPISRFLPCRGCCISDKLSGGGGSDCRSSCSTRRSNGRPWRRRPGGL